MDSRVPILVSLGFTWLQILVLLLSRIKSSLFTFQFTSGDNGKHNDLLSKKIEQKRKNKGTSKLESIKQNRTIKEWDIIKLL